MASRRPFNPARAIGGAGQSLRLRLGPKRRRGASRKSTRGSRKRSFSIFLRRLSWAGEIGNYKLHSSGHIYFTLKDDRSEIACVMWRSSAGALKFKPESGMAVLATGNLDVYESRGTIQLYVRKLEPQGVGPLELAFRQMREKLEKKGFSIRRRRSLCRGAAQDRGCDFRLPGRRSGIFCGPCIGGFLPRMCWCIRVKVQGDGAAVEIAEAIRKIDTPGALAEPVDVLIVGAGWRFIGGSLGV